MSDCFCGTKFRADMHTHTDSSQDSECPIGELCEAQIEKGICAFAITDHFNMHAKDMPIDIEAPIISSFKNATQAAEKYKDKIEVLRGIEVGEGAWDRNLAGRMIERFDFDVVIASVHTVITDEVKIPYAQVDFSALSADGVTKFMDEYFESLLNTANYCDYDILAHLDCPVRYINGKYGLGFDVMRYEDIIREILATVIRRGKALEINTSNCSFCDKFFMPDAKILSLYHEMGGRLLTIGSDAHMAKNAAIAFSDAEKLMKDLGFSELCVFRKRKPYIYTI